MKIKLICLAACCMLISLHAQSPIEARAAFRKKLDNPATRDAAIQEGLTDKDPVIRKKALFDLYVSKGDAAIPQLKALANDPDTGVRLLLIDCLRDIKDLTKRRELADYIAANTKDDVTKREARKLLTAFKFYRKNVRLKDDPTYDHDVKLLQEIPLKDDNWLAITDVVEDGHEKGFFTLKLNEKDWKPIKCRAWEEQFIGNYDGIVWYRIRFDAPPKKEAVGAELEFNAVDEIAWVWLNEKYVGQHDIGPAGWNVPFTLDITNEIKWGATNLLVVRVHDSVAAGGIWKPITLRTLK